MGCDLPCLASLTCQEDYMVMVQYFNYNQLITVVIQGD